MEKNRAVYKVLAIAPKVNAMLLRFLCLLGKFKLEDIDLKTA